MDWNYARWLVLVRKALLSTGHFMNGVYPDTKAWRHYYDSGFMPFEAVNDDMKEFGAKVSIHYRDQETLNLNRRKR